MASKIDTFIAKFSNDKGFSLPLPQLWSVQLLNSGIVGDIQAGLASADVNWEYGVKDISRWLGSEGEILVAQEVTIPTEAYETTILGQDNRGGFMPGYGVTSRTDFLSRTVSINFLETGEDIETSLFRPWVIAIGTKGLLGGKLRSTIVVTEYLKDGSTRKKYTFYDAFPVNVEGYNLSYGDIDFIIKSVAFSYSRYNVQ